MRAFIEVGGRDLDEQDGDGGDGDTSDTALSIAACKGHLEVVTVLVQADTGVDVASSEGGTPLHDAAMKGQLEECASIPTERNCHSVPPTT